jgi:hypothetical protein
MKGPDLKERNASLIDVPHEEVRVEWINVGPTKRATWTTTITVLAITLLLHVALFYSLPRHMLTLKETDKLSAQQKAQEKKNRYINIHLVQPPKYVKPPENKPQHYVMATDAPENKPDHTDNFSSKDQQAAQIIESKDKTGKTPEVENGEMEDSNSLVTGQGKKGQASVSQIIKEITTQSTGDDTNKADESKQQKQAPQQAAGEISKNNSTQPLFKNAIEDAKPHDPTGKGYAEILKKGTSSTDRKIPAVVQSPYVKMEVPQVAPSETTGMRPKPRPRLNLNGAMPTVVKKTAAGLATPTGNIAFDSRLNEFGAYLDRMFEAISTKWNDFNENSPSSVDDAEAKVKISYFVTKDGAIEDLKVVESNATQSAQWKCIDAIKSNAPYEAWTKEMVQQMGNRQPILVAFYYR